MEALEVKAIDKVESEKITRGSPMFDVLHIRNYVLLLIGQSVSLLGDQFQFIALPWLVLQLTGNGLAIGTVLALAGIPRALFMLVGGALTDRFSPRAIMIASILIRFTLALLLTVLVLANLIQLWILYLFALTFGLVDAFFYPAQSSIVPRVVPNDLLQAGNALIQGSGQLSMFFGPVLAGALIVWFGANGEQGTEIANNAPGMRGIGAVFAFEASAFLFAAITLSIMRKIRSHEQAQAIGETTENVLSSIKEGLIAVWQDATMRTTFALIGAISLLVNGPFIVGIPVLANSRFPEGAAGFGMIMSAWGGGSLLGIVLAGMLPKPSPRYMGSILVSTISVSGFGLMLLSIVPSVASASIVTLAMGAANGYVVILYTTWLQKRTAPSMLGRTMSILMFAVVGLNPVSMALAGALIDLNATALLVGAGGLLVVIVLVSAFSPSVRAMGLEKAE